MQFPYLVLQHHTYGFHHIVDTPSKHKDIQTTEENCRSGMNYSESDDKLRQYDYLHSEIKITPERISYQFSASMPD